MPSPDKLFRLDPVETKITAPTSQFQVLAAAADQSIANRSLGRGINAFSNALGSLAKFSKEEQIRDDIKTAKDAAVRGEVMPNVLPVAEQHYQNIVDINTAADSLNEAQRYFLGSEFDGLVQDTGMQSSQKTKGIEQITDDFYARAAQTMQNPESIQKLRLSMNLLKEDGYTKVYEAESDQRSIQGAQAVSHTIKDNIRFSKKLGIPIYESFTPEWFQSMTKSLGNSHPYIPENERKLIIMQQLMANEDILSHPELIFGDGTNKGLVDSDYNKDFSFRNLAFGKGEDAKEYAKMQSDFLTKSKAYFTALDTQEKADRTDNQDISIQSVQSKYLQAATHEGYASELVSTGFFTLAEANKHETALKKYINTNVKSQRYSKEWFEAIDAILAQKVTLKSDVQNMLIEGGLNSDLLDDLMVYATEEGTQKKAFIDAYNTRVTGLTNRVFGLAKLALTPSAKTLLKDIGDRKPTTDEIMALYKGQMTVSPDNYLKAAELVNDLYNEMDILATTYGTQDSIDDTGNGSVKGARLDNFTATMQIKMQGLADIIGNNFVETVDDGVSSEILSNLTANKFPLIMTHKGDIFDRENSSMGDFGSASSAFTFDTEKSFQQTQNLNLKATIMDSISGYPQSLATVVAEMASEEFDPTLDIKVQRKIQTLRDIEDFFSSVGENLSHIPGFLGEVLDPTIKAGKKLEPVTPEEGERMARERLAKIEDTVGNIPQFFAELIDSMIPKDLSSPQEQAPVEEDTLVLGEPTGRVTTEGRKEFSNNFGGTSTEYTIGVTNPQINNGELTHIPSIYDGQIVSQEEAEQIIINNNGIDPETGRTITPGGDPEARSSSIQMVDNTISEGFQLEENGISEEQFNETFDLVAKSIAFIESDNVSDAIQKTDKNKSGIGSARGLFQYESVLTGGIDAAQTALNRHEAVTGEVITETDFSKLSREQQVRILVSDHSKFKGSSAALSKIVKAKTKDQVSQAVAEYWGKIHKKTATAKEIKTMAKKIKDNFDHILNLSLF